ncbi:MAG: phosphatase domain-containing protein, partial [Ilumatobacteraceae bacterium]
WVLVGDDGQRDPQVYAAFAAAHPEAVSAVAVRQLTRTQHLLVNGAGGGSHGPTALVDPSVAATRWVTGADGYELASALDSLGIDGQGTPLEH